MSGFSDLQPAVTAALASLGYSADQPLVRDQLAAAARGTNLAIAAPPSARYSAPALAGLMSALAASGGRALVLAPEFALEEWAAVLLPLAEQIGVPALLASQPACASRRLREGTLRILLTTPATALALVERSALKADGLGHLVLVWPECYAEDAALTALMQDLPSESQRILILADPKPSHPLLERYARRALTLGPLASPEAETSPRPAVRVVQTGWARRGPALAALVEADDPSSMVVWCADRQSAGLARGQLTVGDGSVSVVTGQPPAAALVVAWDLPAPSDLALLGAAGPVVLLVPPHAFPYVMQITSRQTPVRLRGALDEARDQTARRRATIDAELTRGELEGAVLALAPLFERHDPARVAAALYRLWLAKPEAQAMVAESATVKSPVEVARVWIGCGKKDGAGPADIVAVLTREVGVEPAKIGRIELRELFSLVEVPANEAEAIARALSGKTIRRRQVVAKVDQGRPSVGSRGPSGSSPRGRPARPKP